MIPLATAKPYKSEFFSLLINVWMIKSPVNNKIFIYVNYHANKAKNLGGQSGLVPLMKIFIDNVAFLNHDG